jgi:TolA-binding protein
MKPKYKVTGCARFFIFLVIFVPVVFFAATYIRGENGVEIIREFFQKLRGTSSESSSEGDTMSADELQRRLQKAEDEIRELKEELRKKEEEIKSLKQ